MRTNTNDAYATVCRTRLHAQKLRQRAIAAECSGLEPIASRFLSLADMIDDRADHDQLTIAVGGRR